MSASRQHPDHKQGDTHLLPKDASSPSWELTGTQDGGVILASLGKA